MVYNQAMNLTELTLQFEQLTKNVDWDQVRKEQGIRIDMNLTRNLMIRYLARHEIKPVDIAPLVGLKYPSNRQLVYDVSNSAYSAYSRIERELGLV
jgi:hypothetical protein